MLHPAASRFSEAYKDKAKLLVDQGITQIFEFLLNHYNISLTLVLCIISFSFA